MKNIFSFFQVRLQQCFCIFRIYLCCGWHGTVSHCLIKFMLRKEISMCIIFSIHGITEIHAAYSMVFEMWDAAGNYACSDAVTFDCAGGEISATVYKD